MAKASENPKWRTECEEFNGRLFEEHVETFKDYATKYKMKPEQDLEPLFSEWTQEPGKASTQRYEPGEVQEFAKFINKELQGKNKEEAAKVRTDNLSTMKEYAKKYEIKPKEELQQLFQEWDKDPKQAYWAVFEPRDVQQLKQEIKKQLANKRDEPGKEIIRDNLEPLKELAREITAESDDALKRLFHEWDENPDAAISWIEYRVGKPDDFSLIAITV